MDITIIDSRTIEVRGERYTAASPVTNVNPCKDCAFDSDPCISRRIPCTQRECRKFGITLGANNADGVIWIRAE